MKNQSQTKQQGENKGSEIRKPSNQPTYEDKPWQTPQEESCGCGADGKEKSSKKENPMKNR